MNSGNLNVLDAHPKLISAAQKGGYSSVWKIIEASFGELKSKTGLNLTEAERLMRAAASHCSPPYCKGSNMLKDINDGIKSPSCIKTGCEEMDMILGGGIPCSGLTELAGESSSGKTQLALQVAIQCQLAINLGGLAKGVAYICTETQFPVTRLNQLISSRGHLKSFNGKSFSDNVFVHHLPDMDNLVDCIRYQLPQFIRTRGIGLIIIDSVAAVFRASEEPQEIKSKMVQQLGFRLRQLTDDQGVAVLAINQVTSAIDGNIYGMADDNIIPALGLAWANLVTTRVMLRNTAYSVQSRRSSEGSRFPLDINPQSSISRAESRVRSMSVIFCPWLPRRSTPFIVTEKGVEGVELGSLSLTSTDG